MNCRMLIVLFYSLVACAPLLAVSPGGDTPAKYEPRHDRILVLGGQSVRDTRDYYALGKTPRPAGYSDYISYSVGDEYVDPRSGNTEVRKGNDGLLEVANWGAGDQCVACLLDEPGFEQAVINIGMYIGGPEYSNGPICSGEPHCNTARLVRGEFDPQLQVFADWLNSLQGRPVFLRIGYEFDGSWNGYEPEQFKAAWKHIYRFLSGAGVTNVAYVLHSYGYASMETMEAYFPGPDEHSDGYVDWIGYSYFNLDAWRVGINELRFARERGLKVLIGEAAPHMGGDCENQIDVVAEPDWAIRWIHNFFHHVEENRDVVRGIAYINTNWADAAYAPMWKEQDDHNCRGFFYKSNSRLNDSPEVEAVWAEQVSGDLYLNWQSDLYRQLYNAEITR